MAAALTISDITPSNSHKPLTTSHRLPTSDTSAKFRVGAEGRKVAASAHSHAPQHTQTLMRAALKKPTATHQHAVTSHGRTDKPVKQPRANLTPKLSFTGIDAKRLNHAKAIPKSSLISHFSDKSLTDSPATPPVPIPTSLKSNKVSPGLSQAPKTDFLQAAINRSTSHLQPPHKPRPSKRARLVKRIGGVSGMILSVLILVGIVGYQNLTNLQLHLASSRAGFAASLPAYRAAGFNLDNISSTPGEVVAKFINNRSAGHNFVITEKPSGWDSASLRDTYVAPIDKHYRTVEANGRTIYLYDRNNATWVSGEVWYVVTGDGSLSDQQLIDLASSI